MATAIRKGARRPIGRFKGGFPNIIIYADRGSDSARTLAQSLNCRRWFAGEGRYPPGFNATVINWGDSGKPIWSNKLPVVMLNPQDAVGRAINKLETLKCLTEHKIPCLRWTESKDEVAKWLKKKHEVFARKTLLGASGVGITVFDGTGPVPDAPLYTRNYPKTHEFRVHVFDGKVIDFVEKKAKVGQNGTPAVGNRVVRNHDNGWVFAHDNLSPSPGGITQMGDLAIRAVRSLGLLFGAVDILAILTPGEGLRDHKSAVVCEVNTAPGLECTQTIEAYTSAIRTKYLQLRGKN